MKKLTPGLVALASSSVIAIVVFGAGVMISNFRYRELFLFENFLVALVTFSISFFLFLFFFRKYIFNRIREISRIFREFEGEKSDPENSEEKPDELEIVHRNVQSWAEARKKEIEQLRKMEVYRKEYIGNVSHELKTPVFNIQGYISTLLDGGIDDKKINRDYLQRAERSVERMISIIEDLEAISQLESGQLVLEQETFDILTLVKEVIEAQELRAKSKKIFLSFKENYIQPFPVQGDRFRIRQVLTNLIVNSITYGKENGETKIAVSDKGENILVEVIDNGIGIPNENLPRVFERFYRIDKSRSREQGGTGLGLSIVKHILEAHEQNISVSSIHGAGSIFSFTLKKG